MQFDLFPHQKPFHLFLRLGVFLPCQLRIHVKDPQSGRVYSNRLAKLQKSGVLRLKFPLTPDVLRVTILCERAVQKSFELQAIKVTEDTKCPLELTDKDRDFVRFAKWFAVDCDRLSAGEKGTLYQSEGFTILYLDTLTDGSIELTTPARISRASGVIEVSKRAIELYSVPMLLVMLLHEYAHKYKNPEYGKAIDNELTADLIALNIALNLGFDPVELQNCFRAVFATKDTELNRRRMGAINEFISLFVKNESNNCKTRSHAS